MMPKEAEMSIKPGRGHSTKKLTPIEIAREKRIEENNARLTALGIKPLTNALYGSNQSGTSKSTKEGGTKVGTRANDEDYQPSPDDEGLSYSNDEDDSSGPQAKKVKRNGGGKKKCGFGTHVLRQSQRTQERGNITKVATSTLPRQPLGDHDQVMPVVATSGHDAIVPTPPNDLGRSKRKRGLSRGITVQKIVQNGDKIRHVRIPDDKWGPVGKNAKLFKTEVGVVCRLFAPLSVPYWSGMTDVQKAPMFARLADKFALDFNNPHVLEVTDYMLGGRYSDHRHRLYDYIKAYDPIDEARPHPKAGIDPNDWNLVIDHMKSTKFINKSIAGKENCSSVKVLHCSGSKSFLQRREELRDKEIGKLVFYKMTHCNKDGVWSSKKAKENYDKMLELNARPVEEGGTPQTEDQIFDEVLGSPIGFIPGLGHADKPNSSTKVGKATFRQLEETSKRLEQAEKWAELADERADATEKRAAEMSEEVQSQRSTINTLTEKYDQMQSLIQTLALRMDNEGSLPPTSSR